MLITGTDDSRSIERASPPQPPVEKENRRIQRIALPLPARIEVKVDPTVAWDEITRLNDVSAFGTGFTLKRPIKRGRLILITVPMPRQLRSFDYSEPQYRIWGLVRRCISISKSSSEPLYSIGVAFTGRTPPSDFIQNPAKLYDLSHREDDGKGFWHLVAADLRADESQLPKDLRKQTRFSIPEVLLLECVDETGTVLDSETTVTENISLGGAAVFTTMKIEAGGFMRVTSELHDITILSVVRGMRVGSDGIVRLHLEFIDKLFPLEGIETDTGSRVN